jgi:hypothetical protein
MEEKFPLIHNLEMVLSHCSEKTISTIIGTSKFIDLISNIMEFMFIHLHKLLILNPELL